MKITGKLVSFALMALGHLAPAMAQEGLTGLWSSTARSMGGIGRQWQFGADGSVTSRIGAVVNYSYEVQADTLRLRLAGPSAVPGDTGSVQHFQLLGDALLLEPANEKEKQTLTRVGAAPAGGDSIVGDWSFRHYTGGMASFRYGLHHEALLSVPIQSLSGTYRLEGNTLSVRFPGKPDYLREIRQTDGRLVLLASAKEREDVFERAPE